MSFRQRVNRLILSIFLTIALLLGTLVGFSYYLVGKTTTAYQQGEQLTQIINTAREAHINFQRQVQEWKNTLIRGNDPELYKKYFSSFEQKEALMDSKLADLSKLLQQEQLPDMAKKAEAIIANHQVLGQKYREALKANPKLDWQGQQAVDIMVRGIDRDTSSGMDDLVAEIETKVATKFTAETQAVKANTLKTLLGMGLIALLITAGLIFLLIKLMRDLIDALGAEPERAVQATAQIAKGDLTETLNASSPNSLIGSLEMMQLRLRNISLAITASADELKSQAYNISNGEERENILRNIKKLYEAIARIKIDRN